MKNKEVVIQNLVFLAAFFLTIPLANAGSVRGHIRKDGTYVAPHYRSNPDRSYNNNYSTKGNNNPYTGEGGTNNPTLNNKPPQFNKKHYSEDLRQNGSGGNGNYGGK